MKIVHLASGSLSGGAARGTYWLHKALLSLGVDSIILLNHHDNKGDPTVVPIINSKLTRIKSIIRKKSDKFLLSIYQKRERIIFSTGLFGENIKQHPDILSADIINLHWINGSFISLQMIKSFKQPVVWTVRDMWPITGGCHYSLDCNNYLSGCGNCPILSSNSTNDLSRLIFRSKKKNYKVSNLTFVGISEWVTREIRNSELSDGKNTLTIFNSINSEEFAPINTRVAQRILGLGNIPTVLVGAVNTNDFYKGSKELIESLHLLIKSIGSNFQLLVFGTPNEIFSDLPIAVKQLGVLSDIYSLRLAYSAADVFIAPSKMEAFGKTIAESMSCKTPVVAFDATGPKDIISHMQTGYLAKPYKAEDMAKGVEWLLNLDVMSKQLIDNNSRNLVEEKFSPAKIGAEYKNLYEGLIL